VQNCAEKALKAKKTIFGKRESSEIPTGGGEKKTAGEWREGA